MSQSGSNPYVLVRSWDGLKYAKVHVEDMIMTAGRRVYDSKTIELQGQQVERQIGPSWSREDPRSGHLPLLPIAKESARTGWLRVDLDKHWFLCGEAWCSQNTAHRLKTWRSIAGAVHIIIKPQHQRSDGLTVQQTVSKVLTGGISLCV
jgi:hypothetical protein